MPYINKQRRDQLDEDDFPSSPGELNYVITMKIANYWDAYGADSGYKIINDILGALEGAKLEFYRRIAVPYEETKIKANGDVY